MRKILNTVRVSNKLYSTKTKTKVLSSDTTKAGLVISCKRPELNHHCSVSYNQFDSVPLASKGWTHSKAIGDYFTIHPYDDYLNNITYPFDKLGLDTNIISALLSDGIRQATEFQRRAIDAVRTDAHLLLAAETGCGKTLSYLLPVIQSLIESKNLKSDELNSPRAVVLLPNRELAYQVAEVADSIGSSVGLKSKVLVGGRTKQLMMNPNFEDIDILVATPGALSKLSTVGIFRLNKAKFLILDEADTLLDNSFIEIIARIWGRMAQSQVIMVSATVPRSLPDCLKPLENNFMQILSPKIHKPLLNITQKFLRVTHSRKPALLLQATKSNKEPMIIFTNKNQTCNWLALFLNENGIKCSNINGDMNYAIRIAQWNQFVKGETNILAATDVASRGLNTIQVKQLLNYDFPFYAADYLHRIGRIGRLGSVNSCKATNFIAGETEIKLVQQIELAVRRNQPLSNVDGNITNILQKKVQKIMKESA